MRYAFIEEQRTLHSVRRMCELLEVSPAGYYEWRGRPPSIRVVANQTLRERVIQAHLELVPIFRTRCYAAIGSDDSYSSGET